MTAKYIQIATQLIGQIEQQLIDSGAKMPSLRSFCQLHNISMTTALACYRYLEKRDYLTPEYKKGYYVQRPLPQEGSGIKRHTFPVFKSAVCNIDKRPEQRPVADSDYSLATAQLDAKLIDRDALARCLKAATKQADFNLLYDEINGSLALRKQLSGHFTQQGFAVNADELVITNGCLDAVLIALETVSQSGDVIAVSSPCYSGLLDILTTLGRAVIEIPSTEHGMDLMQLENALKNTGVKACLFTANHQNPTGHSLSHQQKKAIAEMGAKYHVPIIEDDVFRELSHQRTVPLPIKHYDQDGWVMWCASVSKTLAPGLRIGWCLPGRFTDKFIQQRMVRTLGVNQPIQLALAQYIAKGYYTRHLHKVNRALRVISAQYISFLQTHLPPQAHVFPPSGGLVLWLKLPKVNTQKLAVTLAQQNVYVKAGNMFSTTTLYQDCLRINMGNIPNQSIYTQLGLLCELVCEQETIDGAGPIDTDTYLR